MPLFNDKRISFSAKIITISFIISIEYEYYAANQLWNKNVIISAKQTQCTLEEIKRLVILSVVLCTCTLRRHISITVPETHGRNGPPIGSRPSRVEWSRDR